MADKLEILLSIKEQNFNLLDKAAGALGRIAEFAIGGVIASGMMRIADGMVEVGRNAVDAAGNMQLLQAQLEGLVANEMMNAGQTFDFISEEAREKYKEAQDRLTELTEDFGEKQAEIQANLAERINEINMDMLEKFLDLRERHNERLEDLQDELASTEGEYEYERENRAEDLAVRLTRMQEDYTHDRESLVKQLAEAESDEEKARLQARIDEMDYEYETRKKRAEEDAALREKREKEAADKRLALIQKQIDDENAAYDKQKQKWMDENRSRIEEAQKQADKELAIVQKKYDEEYAKGTDTLDALKEEYGEGIALPVVIPPAPLLTLDEALEASQGKAEELLVWLRRLSIDSPFQYTQIADMFRFVMAMGASSDEAQELTQSILDFAAGTGMSNEMLNRLGYNLTQAVVAGDLSAANMRQLGLTGVRLAEILQSELGMSLDDIRAKLKNGQLTMEEVSGAFEGYVTEHWAGAADRMSETFVGLKNKISDVFFFAGSDLLTPVLERITPILSKMLDKVTEMLESGKFKEMGEQLADFADKSIVWLEKKLIPAIEQAWKWLRNDFIPAVKDTAKWMQENLVPAVRDLWDWVENKLIPAVSKAWEWFSINLLPTLRELWEKINTDLVPALEKVITSFELVRKQEVPGATDSFGLFLDVLVKVFEILDKLVTPLANLLTWGATMEMIFGPLIDATLNPMLFVLENIVKQWNFIIETSERLGGPLEVIKKAFEGVSEAVQWVLDKIDTLLAKLPKIQIPGVLEQHSPSQMEQSFLGVGRAAALAGAAVGGFANQFSTTNNFYLTANYPMQSQATLTQDVRLLQMLTGEA